MVMEWTVLRVFKCYKNIKSYLENYWAAHELKLGLKADKHSSGIASIRNVLHFSKSYELLSARSGVNRAVKNFWDSGFSSKYGVKK